MVGDACRLLPLVVFFKGKGGIRCSNDYYNHNFSYLPNYGTRCSWESLQWLRFTFCGPIVFVVTMWHRERTLGPKHGSGFVGGYHS